MFAPRLSAFLLVALLAAVASLPATADGPKDNDPASVKPIPPAGNDIPAADRDEIKKSLAELQQLIKDMGTHELLPDVQIHEKAVRWALDYNEIYDGKGGKPAASVKKVLAAGLERAKQLADGKTPWATQTGPVLRGYKSKIDGSVQPYWLIVPKDYDFAAKTKHRLDFWWHGRGETLSEANFMASPQSAGGIIPAPGAMILLPYGRYCNANKFAGEVDTFECLDHAEEHYRVDKNRLVARGFSMGGAACWQFATHFPALWCAAAPGAGFAETPEFLNVFQNEKVDPPWYEKKLWHMYNATDYALNLYNLPTVAYSGEIDKQKQAADVMTREMKKVGLELKHVIGPKTAHAYEKGAKEEVNKLIDAIVEKGKPTTPTDIKFVTYTLRYNTCGWVTVRGLGKHWERARVAVESKLAAAAMTTENVTALTVQFPDTGEGALPVTLEIDGTPVARGLNIEVGPFHFRKSAGKWARVESLAADGLAKKPGLQGPIDDAFMDSFVMVKPSGRPMHDATRVWVNNEMKHAVEHWRKQFRGDAVVKGDNEVTKEDIANSNLILWGDPMSNAYIGKIADKLPIKWTAEGVTVGKDTYKMSDHMPVLIYPNPLNPAKYVVINSGCTFREYDYLNNARQVSKLPDYAVIDITTPPNARYPGKVVRAGFFGEKWELLANDGR